MTKQLGKAKTTAFNSTAISLGCGKVENWTTDETTSETSSFCCSRWNRRNSTRPAV